MTTVGYGDMIPITIPGRLLGVVCMFSGIVLMAICVIIIGGNFEQVHQSSLIEKKRTNSIAEVSALGATGIAPNSDPNATCNPIRLSIASPRMKRHQLFLPVENLELRVSEIEVKFKTLTDASRRRTSVAKKVRFPWLVKGKTFSNFSDKLVQTIMCYLTDDDRFLVREVNMSFYNAYYTYAVDDFNVAFDFGRAIRMAMKGRVFYFVVVLRVQPGELPKNALRNITTTSFPNLKCIHVTTGVKATIWYKSKAIAKFFHRGLTEFEVHLDGEFSDSINLGARFPELKKLKIIFRATTLFTLPSSHKNLEEINVVNCNLVDDDITKKRFPMLRTVNGIVPYLASRICHPLS